MMQSFHHLELHVVAGSAEDIKASVKEHPELGVQRYVGNLFEAEAAGLGPHDVLNPLDEDLTSVVRESTLDPAFGEALARIAGLEQVRRIRKISQLLAIATQIQVVRPQQTKNACELCM